jgi:hypothetical protein
VCEARFKVAVFCRCFMPVDRQVRAAAVGRARRMVARGRGRHRANLEALWPAVEEAG